MTRSRKRRLNRTAKSVGNKARQFIPEAGGAIVSAVAGIIGGPLGILASVLAVPVTTWGLRELLLHTQLSQTESQRIAAVLREAAMILEEKLDAGATLRSDWFGPDATERQSADEAIEHVVRVAKDDPYQKKQRHYAALLANISIHSLDPDMVAMLIARAERLSFRQLCMLALFFQERMPKYSIKPSDIKKQSTSMQELSVFMEFNELRWNFTAASEDTIPASPTLPALPSIDITIQMVGRLMEVETIDVKELDGVYRLLEATATIDLDRFNDADI